MELGKTLATLRKIRGWTQEELAERCGLSVRTIRNVELGWVENPRRSSVNLMVRALDAEGVDHGQLNVLGGARWRGIPAPDHPIVGMRAKLDELARTVLANPLTTFIGVGGVGKTRIGLAVAARIAVTYRYGVALVELGDLPAEVPGSAPPTATVLDRVRRLIGDGPAWSGSTNGPARNGSVSNGPAWNGPEPPPPDGWPGSVLLVLDNAEHLPAAVTTTAKVLLSEHPCIHILITTRRPLTERLGVCREIGPLDVEPVHDAGSALAPAVELVLRRANAGLSSPIDLDRDIPAVVELCRRLGGIPRALEFAAERLRTIPIHSLLASGPALSMLRTSDHSLLPHQRSLTDSIRWSIDLLSDDHRRLLQRIAGLPATRFTLDRVLHEVDPWRGEPDTVLCLLSDLVDNALISNGGGRLYEYRLMPYVKEVICAEEIPRYAYAR